MLDERTLRLEDNQKADTKRLEEKIDSLKELLQTKDDVYEERYVRNERFQETTERLAESYVSKEIYNSGHAQLIGSCGDNRNAISSIRGQLMVLGGGGLAAAVALIVLEIMKS